jgi:xylulokinase
MGLRRGTQFVVGGFDQAMATLGAGAVEVGMAHDGNGSWEALSVRLPGRSIDRRLRAAGWSTGPSASDPSRLEIMASWPGGMALRWVVGLVSGGRVSDRAIARSLSRLPSGVPRAVAVPDLAGTDAGTLGGAGAIAGLSLGMGHGDVVLAVLAGLASRLRSATLAVSNAGVPISCIRATGGGARSDRWLQLKADATGLPIERPVELAAGAFAAAVLAGAAVGVLPEVEVAVRELVEVDRRFEPDATATSRSAHEAERHRALADAVATLVAS